MIGIHNNIKIIQLFLKTTAITLGFCISAMSNTQAQPANDTSIVYIHQAKPSFKALLIKKTAKLILPKKSISRKLGKDHFVSTPAAIPKKLLTEFIIDTTQVNGRNIFTVSPKGKKSGKYVLFLHGGAYINSIFRQHWNFAAKIIRETNCSFILPDYPLAPASSYREAFATIAIIYQHLLSQTDSKNIILMGDSAGGGLALAFVMKQQNDSAPLPAQIILLSPWLDVTMTNPEIKEVQRYDATLKADQLVLAGQAWADGTGTTNYMISPIYGSLDRLPKISIFIGTHDILAADCRKLRAMAENKGIPVNYFEYPEMFHDWMMILSLKESENALLQICYLITEDKH